MSYDTSFGMTELLGYPLVSLNFFGDPHFPLPCSSQGLCNTSEILWGGRAVPVLQEIEAEGNVG